MSNEGIFDGSGDDSSLDQIIDDSLRESSVDSSSSSEGAESGPAEAGGQDSKSTPQQGTGKGGDADSRSKSEQEKQGQSAAGPKALETPEGVVQGGRERRFYEQREQARAEASELRQQLAQLQGELDGFRTANTSVQQTGINGAEMDAAVRIMASWKNDPVQTINYLLTEAKAAGYDVGNVGGGNVDTNALTQIIDQKLQPFLEEREQRAEAQRIQQESASEVQQFVTRYPDSVVHENALASLLEADPDLTLETAYYRLQNYYLREGLDWKKPLELIAQERSQGTNAQQPGQQPRAPLPQGKGGTANTEPVVQGSAPADDAWDNIVRSAMQEAGTT